MIYNIVSKIFWYAIFLLFKKKTIDTNKKDNKLKFYSNICFGEEFKTKETFILTQKKI